MIALSWYLLKMVIVSGILCGYYYLALRNRVFHKWNRFYLLLTVLMSIVLPLISIRIYPPATVQHGTAIRMLQSFTLQDEIVIEIGRKSAIPSWEWLLFTCYSTISFILLATFIRSMLKIRDMKRRYPNTIIEGINFFNTNSNGTPFSFFNSIFWNASIDLHSYPGKQIFNHEMAHIIEKHSYDKVFINAVLWFFWCNPFFWLIRKEVSMIHEFVADKIALKEGDTHSLAEMILSSAFAGRQFSITNNFFHSPIKRRLLMLMKNKNSKVNYLTRLMALPIATLIFAGISCKMKSNNETPNEDSISVTDVTMKPMNDAAKDTTPLLYYQGKKIVSLDVVTPAGKPFADIKYDDGSTERITLKEAESRGFNIPAPPPPPPSTAKVKFTPPKIVKDEKVQFTPPKIVKDNRIYVKVEKEAAFPGGNDAWVRYIRRAIEKSIDQFTEKDFGTCIVKFIVERDGHVSDVMATTMKGTTLAKVAVDAIKKGPMWIPAQQNGQSVNAYRLQPVTLTNPTK